MTAYTTFVKKYAKKKKISYKKAMKEAKGAYAKQKKKKGGVIKGAKKKQLVPALTEELPPRGKQEDIRTGTYGYGEDDTEDKKKKKLSKKDIAELMKGKLKGKKGKIKKKLKEETKKGGAIFDIISQAIGNQVSNIGDKPQGYDKDNDGLFDQAIQAVGTAAVQTAVSSLFS